MARGLGFTDNKNGVEYVRWNVVRAYLADLKFSQEVAKDTYIPENIFYRLACAACANANSSIDGRLKCTYTPLKVFSYNAGFFNHFRYTGEECVYAVLPEEPLPMMSG